MGTYLNPGNSGFSRIISSDYVDKTGLISLLNRTIGTTKNLTCISRPRRFGKSYAAQMLCAYYDKTCDSHELFDRLEIAKDQTYEKHIGKYDVIYLDMTNLLGKVKANGLVDFIADQVTEEVILAYPEVGRGSTFDQTLINCAEHTGNKFIMIIDEWDAPIRETPESEQDYLRFLRMLFKSSGTTSRIFAAAYMTGILPIKKDGSQSAISDFQEYSVLDPLEYAKYVGFTEEEVKEQCGKHHKSFDSMKQ